MNNNYARNFVSVIFCVAIIVSCDCTNTSLKYFFTEENRNPQINFSGYNIEIQISAIALIGSSCTDSFILSIQSTFAYKLNDTNRIDSIGMLQLDSIYIDIPKTKVIIFPKLSEFGRGPSSIFQEGRLFGPSYLFKPIYLPDSCVDIVLHFRAHLFDRRSGAELISKNYEEKLHRNEKKKFNLVTDGLCAVN